MIIDRVTDIDLRLLRIFKTVTDCGGFSAAESALNMNLSTISTHMADLETRVGLRLCERGRRGFHLTDEGKSLYEAAERLLDSVEEFRAGVSEMHHKISGELAIGVVDNTITDKRSRIAEAICAVKERSGDLHIKLEIGSPAELQEAVLERKLNVAIGPFRTMLPGLTYESLYRETLYLYCGSDHPLFNSDPKSIEIDSLRALDYVSRGYMRETKELGDATGLKVAATVYDMEAVATLLLSGKFVGYLPEHFAARWVKEGMMRALRPDVVSHDAAFNLVTRKDREATVAVKVFVDAVTAGCRSKATG